MYPRAITGGGVSIFLHPIILNVSAIAVDLSTIEIGIAQRRKNHFPNEIHGGTEKQKKSENLKKKATIAADLAAEEFSGDADVFGSSGAKPGSA